MWIHDTFLTECCLVTFARGSSRGCPQCPQTPWLSYKFETDLQAPISFGDRHMNCSRCSWDFICLHMCVHMCVYVLCVYTCAYGYMCLCLYARVHMCLCVHVCVLRWELSHPPSSSGLKAPGSLSLVSGAYLPRRQLVWVSLLRKGTLCCGSGTARPNLRVDYFDF